MKTNYYCLIAGLPDLTIDDSKLSFNDVDFRTELIGLLDASDMKQFDVLFLKYDNENLLHILEKETGFNTKGIYSKEVLEEEIKEPANLPTYMVRFIQMYKERAPLPQGVSWQNKLTSMYFEHINNICSNEFLKDWFRFELDLHNIITAYQCKSHNLPVKSQLIGDNEIVEQILKSNARDFGLGQEYSFVEKLLFVYENGDLLEQEKEIDMLKWHYLDETSFFHYFSIEKVISFALKLRMVERWIKLDEETGRKLFREFVGQLEKSYEFPEEFSL